MKGVDIKRLNLDILKRISCNKERGKDSVFKESRLLPLHSEEKVNIIIRNSTSTDFAANTKLLI